MRRITGHYENEVLLSLLLPDAQQSLLWTSHEDRDENDAGFFVGRWSRVPSGRVGHVKGGRI